MVGQRARREDDKQERRDALLDAAAALVDSPAWGRFSVADVAARTGLSKATVFLYYPTREALLLALLERELAAWFEAFEAELARGGRWSPGRVGRAVAHTFLGRTALLRLLAQLEGVLEHNIPVDVARAYKVHLGRRLASAGAALERRLEFLAPGEGGTTLLRVRALVSGLWQMADASPVVDALLREPELAPMRVRFEDELEPSVTALLVGMQHARAG